MKCYMRLMHCAPTNWLDVVVMWVEVAMSSWVNAVLQDVASGHGPVFHTWDQFKKAMVQRFESATAVEEA